MFSRVVKGWLCVRYLYTIRKQVIPSLAGRDNQQISKPCALPNDKHYEDKREDPIQKVTLQQRAAAWSGKPGGSTPTEGRANTKCLSQQHSVRSSKDGDTVGATERRGGEEPEGDRPVGRARRTWHRETLCLEHRLSVRRDKT